MSTTTVGLAINCLVFGENKGHAFTVWIAPEGLVGELKGLIKQERSNTYRDVDAASLCLHRMPPEHRGEPPHPDKLEALNSLTAVGNAFPNPPRSKIHVLVSRADDHVGTSPASTPDFQLWCLVDGDDLKWAFKVRMQRGANVNDLKNSIKQALANRLSGVDAAYLDLYQAVDEADPSEREPAWRALADPKSRLVDVFSKPLPKGRNIDVKVS